MGVGRSIGGYSVFEVENLMPCLCDPVRHCERGSYPDGLRIEKVLLPTRLIIAHQPVYESFIEIWVL